MFGCDLGLEKLLDEIGGGDRPRALSALAKKRRKNARMSSLSLSTEQENGEDASIEAGDREKLKTDRRMDKFTIVVIGENLSRFARSVLNIY